MQNTTASTATLISDPAIASVDYNQAEQLFLTLLDTDDLDQHLDELAPQVEQFENAIASALEAAYRSTTGDDQAHLFLQRVLYRINRLNLFWYDDLRHYTNERSFYLQKVRNQIEQLWQAWELQFFDVAALQQTADVKQALHDRNDADLNPPITESRRYLREDMTREGYRHLLAIASLDGLVEASRLSRILGGAANEVQCMLVRVLLEEYGNGRYSRKHSTFFAQMMEEMGLRSEPESYFDIVPWEVLASINHNFLLTERKIHFLRYNGGLTYFEIAGPNAYRDYMAAAQRLNLSHEALSYWELHIREDERHGQWMLRDVALPLVDRYPDRAWELLLGYDQEKLIGDRAGEAVLRSVKRVDQQV